MICPECEGTGRCAVCDGSGFTVCRQCEGTGILRVPQQSGSMSESRCPFCSGRGQIVCESECQTCGGLCQVTQEELDRAASPPKYREHGEFISWQILMINIVFFIGGAVSVLLFKEDYILRLFACNGDLIMRGEIWRIVTSIFIHIDFYHFFVNSYALLLICLSIEKLTGKSKFLGIYMASGIVGNILTVFLRPHIWSAGASGALYGILGAYFGLQNRYKIFKSSLFLRIAILTALDTILALLPAMRVNILAHLGGLLCGFILSSFLTLEENRELNQ